ncbi:hypothetical protein OHB12_20760 [Nocardia sp. NBC_01730]|uniref:hypothetical protein n=1 Tax=Nocardia sp. NBC_01730 TaxID=2975998 RepID=UPI002E129EDE|nr:hypothetical protein OHB12_20760 [Nocardia sp. NBC_01730]
MDTVAQHILWFLPMLWLGMVLAISFLGAPLKFRAPGITLPSVPVIGRLVFRALNVAETVPAVLLVVAALVMEPGATPWLWLAASVALLAVQVLVVRPPLTRRTDRVLAGEGLPRSPAHFWSIGFQAS